MRRSLPQRSAEDLSAPVFSSRPTEADVSEEEFETWRSVPQKPDGSFPQMVFSDEDFEMCLQVSDDDDSSESSSSSYEEIEEEGSSEEESSVADATVVVSIVPEAKVRWYWFTGTGWRKVSYIASIFCVVDLFG